MGLLSTFGAASGRAFGLTRVGAAIKDAYFNLVTLLLPGDGTNGAQNNTFLDSSTNNFTITRNGNTTQGTFSPFSQTGWSNYFNGSTDYLSFSDNAAFEVGSGDFTIEAWVNFSALPSTNGYQATIASKWGNATNQSYEFYLYNNAGTYQLYITYSTNGSTTTNAGVNWTPTVGVWYHIAAVRSGSNLYFWVNGTQQGSTQSISGTIFDGNGTFQIGSFNATANTYLNGYLSNWRLTKGGALYTSSFTPSTTPLTTTVSAGTVSLLTCQSNRFLDNSSNAFAITVNGTPSVQAFSPFAPTAAYSAATNGGSGRFDGTGDYLRIATATGIDVGTGNFTLEFWFYAGNIAATAGGGVGSLASALNTSTARGVGISFGSSGIAVRFGRSVAGQFDDITVSATLSNNTWYFVQLVRTSTSTNGVTVYLNGTQVGQGTSAQSLNMTAFAAGMAYPDDTGGGYFTGYITDVRFSNTARSAGVPSAPLSTDANTVVLMRMRNAGITDATAKNDLETVGNAQISTTQSKFGGSSMYFDGTGDYLQLPASQNLNLGSGSFTVEAWVYNTSRPSGINYPIWDCRNPTNSISTTGAYYGLTDTNGYPFLYCNGYIVTGSSAPSLNTWAHIAWVRNGTTLTIYLNGTSVGSATFSNSLTDPGVYVSRIGQSNSGGAENFTGYIDDLRITKGYARYTANFTAPTAAFQLS